MEIMEIKRKMKEAIHDRLLGPNQNGGKGYELPAILTTRCQVTKYKIH